MTGTPAHPDSGVLTPRELRSLAHTALAMHPRNVAATERLLSGRYPMRGRSRASSGLRRALAGLRR